MNATVKTAIDTALANSSNYLRENDFPRLVQTAAAVAQYIAETCQYIEDNKVDQVVTKIDHVLIDVMKTAHERAKLQNLDHEITEALVAAALLHDLTRFDAISSRPLGDAFNDGAYGDHGGSAAAWLTEGDHFQQFVNPDILSVYGRCIELAVGSHSVAAPQITGDNTQDFFIHELRLADKTSLHPMFITAPISAILAGVSQEQLNNTTIHPKTYAGLVAREYIIRDVNVSGVFYSATRHYYSHIGFLYDPKNDTIYFRMLKDMDFIRAYGARYQPVNELDQIRHELILKVAELYIEEKLQ